jgi:hypothetical protein
MLHSHAIQLKRHWVTIIHKLKRNMKLRLLVFFAVSLMAMCHCIGQNFVLFTNVFCTSEQAIRLTWTSVSNETYQIQCASELGTNGVTPVNLDWTKVRHLTINRVEICHWGIDLSGDNPPAKSTVNPYAILYATVDTGQTNLDVEIDSPIIDLKK